MPQLHPLSSDCWYHKGDFRYRMHSRKSQRQDCTFKESSVASEIHWADSSPTSLQRQRGGERKSGGVQKESAQQQGCGMH